MEAGIQRRSPGQGYCGLSDNDVAGRPLLAAVNTGVRPLAMRMQFVKVPYPYNDIVDYLRALKGAGQDRQGAKKRQSWTFS